MGKIRIYIEVPDSPKPEFNWSRFKLKNTKFANCTEPEVKTITKDIIDHLLDHMFEDLDYFHNQTLVTSLGDQETLKVRPYKHAVDITSR